MNDTQLFDYINQHSLNNDFTNSLQQAFQKYGKLTPRQRQCLETSVSNHEICTRYFSENADDENKFFMSLKKQFEEKGFLTPKQMKCLDI